MSAEKTGRGGARRGGMTRRRALGPAGVAGAAYVAGPLPPFGSRTIQKRVQIPAG